jgi:hypothetical protein
MFFRYWLCLKTAHINRIDTSAAVVKLIAQFLEMFIVSVLVVLVLLILSQGYLYFLFIDLTNKMKRKPYPVINDLKYSPRFISSIWAIFWAFSLFITKQSHTQVKDSPPWYLQPRLLDLGLPCWGISVKSMLCLEQYIQYLFKNHLIFINLLVVPVLRSKQPIYAEMLVNFILDVFIPTHRMNVIH